MTPDDRLPWLPPRRPDAHKGDFGTVLIVGGSVGMAGAAALAGMAALRGGAGLVRVAVPLPVAATVAGFEPAYTTVPLPADRAGRIALDARPRIEAEAARASVVALGPGLGRSAGLDALVAALYRRLPLPLVIDADGLNALAERPAACDPPPAAERILTPHPGEFARLTGHKPAGDQRVPAAIAFARQARAVVVLKGRQTVTAAGDRHALNTSGNPGMATGGSGDVLTGLIAALVAQGLWGFDAARLGVYLHGAAGDLAAKECGQVSLVATDIIRFLPAALLGHAKASEG